MESDGILIPKNTVNILTIETTKQHGDIIIEDHVNIPDPIYRIRDSKVQIPISNNSETDLKLRDEQINYKFINVTPEREERISYITQEELNARLKLLNENLTIRLKHIEGVFKSKVEKIITSYHDLLTLPGDLLPSTGLTSHKIILKDEGNINLRQPRHPECHKEEIFKQVNEMLTKKIIEESDSPFNSPLWGLPEKRDASGKQKWRLAIYFRKMNKKTDQNAYPRLVIDDILDHLGNAKFFSGFDLSSGFRQISMDDRYTAFSTPEGHFHYNCMPFGLKNAPATFQRMMDTALRDLIGKI